MSLEKSPQDPFEPINIDQAKPENVFNAGNEKRELEAQIKEQEKRISEIENEIKLNSSEEYKHRDLLNDIKEDLAEKKILLELENSDDIQVAKVRDQWASQIFSGKDNNLDIIQ